MLYLCSPYYRNNRHSGANKRFESLIREWESEAHSLTIIVKEGHKPPYVDFNSCIFIPSSICKSRALTFFWLSIKLSLLPRGTLINDFNPIPFLGYMKHDSYSLIHDLRRLIDDEGNLINITARIYNLVLKAYPKIITVSNESKKLLVNYLKIPSQNIIVSYNGINYDYTSKFQALNRDIDILYVAHFEERKRHNDLLQALSLFSTRSLNVVFVGVDNGYYEKIKPWIKQASDAGHSIEILSELSESELIDLYRRTKIYAFPSVLEGFGMPLIEAKSQGCKILCSDLDVFKEIGNSSNYYFKAKDIQSLLLNLNTALKDNSNYSQFIDDRFIWKNIAKSLLSNIKKLSEK